MFHVEHLSLTKGERGKCSTWNILAKELKLFALLHL